MITICPRRLDRGQTAHISHYNVLGTNEWYANLSPMADRRGRAAVRRKHRARRALADGVATGLALGPFVAFDVWLFGLQHVGLLLGSADQHGVAAAAVRHCQQCA